MQLQTGEYQKLQVRQYPQRTLRETAEGRYWKQFRGTTALQQVSKTRRMLDSVDRFCSTP